LHTVLISIFK